MKEQSELPHIVSIFYNEILVRFNKHIKILRSDNALEYTQSMMNSFWIEFTSNPIWRKISPTHYVVT
jgi:hypothetical protein